MTSDALPQTTQISALLAGCQADTEVIRQASRGPSRCRCVPEQVGEEVQVVVVEDALGVEDLLTHSASVPARPH
jgi:hypothetical protein